MTRRLSARPLRAALVTLLALVASAALASERAAAAPVPAQSVLIVQVGWDGSGDIDAAPLTPARADLLDWWDGRVGPWFRDISRGVSGLNVSAQVPAVTIGTPPTGQLGTRNRCEGNFFGQLAARADAAVRAQGQVDPDAFDLVAYYWAPFGCLGANDLEITSRQVGDRLFFQGFRRSEEAPVMVARALGLPPADALLCRDALGRDIRISGDCSVLEAEDPWDIRGDSTGGLAAPALDQLGWLDGHKVTVTPCSPCSQQVTLNTLSLAGTSGNFAVELKDGVDALGRPVTYWFEYRVKTGLDVLDWGEVPDIVPGAGVVIHIGRSRRVLRSWSQLRTASPTSVPRR